MEKSQPILLENNFNNKISGMTSDSVYIDDFDMCWESLKELVKNSGIRFSTHSACIPQHSPLECLSNVSAGIYPTIKNIFKE